MELACQDIVFHFNKKYLEDPSIPMWCLKTKGKTLYVNHVECNVPWNTKETIDSSHTKGSIKIKNALLTIDDSNDARITSLTKEDALRLRSQLHTYTRLIWSQSVNGLIEQYLQDSAINHSPIRTFAGGCGTVYMVADIHKKSDVVALELAYYGKFRVLQPNEYHYKAYEDPKYVDSPLGYESEDEDVD